MQEHCPWLLGKRFESLLDGIREPRQSSKSESLQRHKPQLKKRQIILLIAKAPLETLPAA
jgi:hypothetical protein